MSIFISAKKIAKDSIAIGLVTTLIFFAVDFFAGAALLSMARKEGKRDSFRTSHSRYHHTLQASYQGPAYWGPFTYNVCTNASGMKSDCADTALSEKHFDIAFIGDSFTEGVGVPYEESFVGMVAKAHPELKIANLGVVSYTPTIYLRKLEDYLSRGYTFKKVVVFVDIGDIMDESQYVEDAQGNALLATEVIQPGAIQLIKRVGRRNLPLTYEGLHNAKQFVSKMSESSGKISSPATALDVLPSPQSEGIHSVGSGIAIGSISIPKDPVSPQALLETADTSSSKTVGGISISDVSKRIPASKAKEPWIYERDYARSAWTYNLDAPNYGDLGVRGSIAKAVSQMERVSALLKAHNTALSVGVYPWPAQLIFDQEDSLQVQIWKKFCEDRCVDFYNAFPLFFKSVRAIGLEPTIAKYYFAGDMHFGKEGNALIAETILSKPLTAP
jgi:hypothetical protein